MKDYPTEGLRNVALFSHGGAGKTTLSEATFYDAGVINRLGRVEEGTTVSDYDQDEIKRGISVQCSILPFDWEGAKINLLDTPGYADFVGEVRQALRVVEGAIAVIDAVAGCEVGTELTWQYAEELGLPRLIFINKLDRENADFHRALEQTIARLRTKIVPFQLPIGSQADFKGVVDLVKMKAFLDDGGRATDIPSTLADTVASWREKLVEAVAESDDELLTKYLEGEELSEKEIVEGLRRAVLSRALVPVLCGSALTNKAIKPLLSTMVSLLPSPVDGGPVKGRNPNGNKEEERVPSITSSLAALVFKTTADPYVGRLSYLRVYSGLLRSDSVVWNANKGREERIGQLFHLRGKTQEPVGQLGAGDIGAVAKLQETTTGDTLCDKERPLLLPGVTFPRPTYSVAIEPKTKADLDKLGVALSRLVDEDLTLQTRKDPDTGETIVSSMGESHVEIAAEKMKRKFGVDVILNPPKVPYKETILTTAKAEYKHKKQTGGHGQYGHVFLELEPLPRGAGFEFGERLFGGAVPRNYVPAVEKGVREALAEGILANYPVVDLKVTLYDGSYHPVDSSEMSFKIAASHALRKGLEIAHSILLEPIVDLTVMVPEEHMGDVLGDLNSKRCRVLGMDTFSGTTTIHAQGPLGELQRYATDLRSLTQGRGTYSLEFSHSEEVPAHIAQNIIAEAKKRAAQKE